MTIAERAFAAGSTGKSIPSSAWPAWIFANGSGGSICSLFGSVFPSKETDGSEPRTESAFAGPSGDPMIAARRIAAGDFAELCQKKGEEEAVREILLCIAHELTHYYQWLNDIKLTERGEERQAAMQSKLVVSAYLSQRQERAWADGFQKLSYYAIFRFDPDGINISFPDLPGCLSCAFSENQAVPMAEEALSLWLSGMEYGELPPPSPVDLFTCRANESAHEIAVSVRVKDGIIE